MNRFGGAIVQCNEQGMTACFGYPAAYEDAAQRAARAALDLMPRLQEIAKSADSKASPPLAPWVGFHSGPVVVEMDCEGISLAGGAPGLTKQIAALAESGHVVCSEDAYRLICEKFTCNGLGRHHVRGASQGIELFAVHAVEENRNPVESAAPTGLTPLTGRDHEVSLLKDRWEQAQEEMGQVVLLIGEPGLGKSRLACTLKQHVLGQMAEGEVDAPVIEWRCAPHFQYSALYPAIEFFERKLGANREEPPQARFDRMLYRLRQYDLADPEAVPLWASLLSLPTPEPFPRLSLSPARQREETFRLMLRWLRVRASRKPILFIVEDLHWVDASTLEFLQQFLAEGLHDSILTVLTFRPEFQTPWPALSHQTSLALNRLTRRQVEELVRTKSDAIPESIVEQIFNRTGGVPLFVEEFTKLITEQKAESPSGAAGQILPGREIPATLQDLLIARLHRMQTDPEVTQLAAALGRDFSYELLAAVATIDEPVLQLELAKLVAGDILHQQGAPPHCEYRFKHALLEDAAYNSLLKDKRRRFHERIATVLEQQFPLTTETQPELVAHHFTEAGRTEQAVDYWLRAGLHSRDRSAEHEAISHLERGLQLLGELAESTDRDAKELALLNPLGTAYTAVRGYAAEDVGPIYQRANALCERVGDPAQSLGMLWGTWAWHVVRGELNLAKESADQALELARRSNDPGILSESLMLSNGIRVWQGEFAAARESLEMALTQLDDRDRNRRWSQLTGHDAGVSHRCYLAVALWHLGYPDQALRMSREAVEVARSTRLPLVLAFALAFSSWLYVTCRLSAEGRAAASELKDLALKNGFQHWKADSVFYQLGSTVIEEDVRSCALEEFLEAAVVTFAASALPRRRGAAARLPPSASRQIAA